MLGAVVPAAAVQDAMPAAQAALDAGICEVRIQRAIDQEWRYIRAMAELGAGPYEPGDVASKLGRKTSEVSMIRQRLLDKGLVYATGCPSGGTERQPGRHMRRDRPLELLSAAPRLAPALLPTTAHD